jgi:hypothetical protein
MSSQGGEAHIVAVVVATLYMVMAALLSACLVSLAAPPAYGVLVC